MAVVTENGLVGKVTTVGKDVAVVLLVSDESLRVSVSIEGTQEQGIVSGTRASSNYAPDLRIRFLSKTANLTTRDESPDSRGGRSLPFRPRAWHGERFFRQGVGRSCFVTPAVDLADLQDVFVIIRQK